LIVWEEAQKKFITVQVKANVLCILFALAMIQGGRRGYLLLNKDKQQQEGLKEYGKKSKAPKITPSLKCDFYYPFFDIKEWVQFFAFGRQP
jgi:hypothetical protein